MSTLAPTTRAALPVFWLILALGLGLRLLWVLAVPVDPVSDSDAYLTFALNIHLHGVYGFTPEEPSAYWAVGPAAIYAGAFDVFGHESFVGVVVVNLIASLVILWGLYDLGRRWFGETAGRVAMALFAIWPLAIQYTTVLASELHFMALVLLGLVFWDRARTEAGLAWGLAALVLSGLAFAGATYVRPIALLIPAALAVAAVLRAPRSALPEIGKAALVIALIITATLPWQARNERVFGEPVFMSTNFWANFWMGNHPGTNGLYAVLPTETDAMGWLEREDYLQDLALDYIREEPGAFVTRTLWKAVRLHERETIGVAWNQPALEARFGTTLPDILKLASTGYWYLMLGLAFAGIVILARRQGAWATLLSVPVWLWLYYTALHAIIVVGDRYHMPAIPMIALLAALAVSAYLERGNQDDRPA